MHLMDPGQEIARFKAEFVVGVLRCDFLEVGVGTLNVATGSRLDAEQYRGAGEYRFPCRLGMGFSDFPKGPLGRTVVEPEHRLPCLD